MSSIPRPLVILMLFPIATTAWCQAPSRDCATHDILPKWSVKRTGQNNYRFVIDATGVTSCIKYYDIEFVAHLLDAKGAVVTTRRFAAPNYAINGPTVITIDFTYAAENVVNINGVAMNCKKRTVGVLPGPQDDPLDNPTLQQRARIQATHQDELRSYTPWHDVAIDYEEDTVPGIRAPGEARMICSSRNFARTDIVGDHTDPCADIRNAAHEIERDRQQQFGDPILPTK